MNLRFLTILFASLFTLCIVNSALAQPKVGNPKTPDDLELIDVSVVKDVPKADLIVLSNGKTYHLDQIRVPVVYEQPAIDFLKKSLLGKKIGVYLSKEGKLGPKDRFGNMYGHILKEDGNWVQAEMVAKGLAWAYSTETNRDLIIPLYRYEETARGMKQGFWKNAEYAVKNGRNIAQNINSFQIYEGQVSYVRLEGDRFIIYCDGGANRVSNVFAFWINTNHMPLFMKGKTGNKSEIVARWIGGFVRVRGWIEKDSSGESELPMLEVTHPEQMEFLDPTTGKPTTKYE